MYHIRINDKTYQLDDYPAECPFCNKSITPHIISGYRRASNLEIFMYCPSIKCAASFISYYLIRNPNTSNPTCIFTETMVGNISVKVFSDLITNKFPSFTSIYNEAFTAEQYNLSEICGVGYRKALEFLIKDYCILNNLDKKDEIEKTMLGKVIDNFVDDTRIKSVSKRATWLGNDETHYIRKWTERNIDDLKLLITLTLHWIEAEELTKTFEEQMPV